MLPGEWKPRHLLSSWPHYYRTPSYSFPPLYSVDSDDFLLQITSKAGQKESQPMFTMATLWSVNLNLASCWVLCVQSQECLLIVPSSVTVPPSLSKSHITSLTRCAFKWGSHGPNEIYPVPGLAFSGAWKAERPRVNQPACLSLSLN